MHIGAVSVCVGYGDFLEHVAQTWLEPFDEIIIVTTLADHRTRDVCHKLGINAFYVDQGQEEVFFGQGKFRLGAATNAGLHHLSRRDWVCTLDADIWLPDHTRSVLESGLDRRKLYGCDRMHCIGWSQWQKFQEFEVQKDGSLIRPAPLRLGVRVWQRDQGYCPCGYFSLWHPTQSTIKDYPNSASGTAQGSDMIHATRWRPENRELLPGFIAVELMTAIERGINWTGRKSPEFGPLSGD